MNIADLYTRIRGHRITTDSRKIEKGDVFIALKGETFDGNQYAETALKQGAALAIIDNPQYAGTDCLLVEDGLLCLQQLAHYHRRQLNIPILGITGTNGKTTTKELCHAVLSRKFKTFATQGNYNNHIGVPLTLLSMNETTEIGIVEMGANHPGEIETLCQIAEPDFGIITNIGQAHLEGFGSYENIIATKQALYTHVMQKNGELFVNAADELLMEISKQGRRDTYGKNGESLSGDIKQTVPYLVYSILAPKGQLYIKTHLVGDYNFDNAMAASCVGMHFGVDPLEIQAAIESYHPSNLRSQLIQTDHNTLILDAYNANPSSMKVSISNFKNMPGEHKILILGEMRELGSISKEAHQHLIEQVADSHFEKIFLIGNHFEHCQNMYNFISWFQDTDALIKELMLNKPEQAFILVKGSRGNQLERIVEYL